MTDRRSYNESIYRDSIASGSKYRTWKDCN